MNMITCNRINSTGRIHTNFNLFILIISFCISSHVVLHINASIQQSLANHMKTMRRHSTFISSHQNQLLNRNIDSSSTTTTTIISLSSNELHGKKEQNDISRSNNNGSISKLVQRHHLVSNIFRVRGGAVEEDEEEEIDDDEIDDDESDAKEKDNDDDEEDEEEEEEEDEDDDKSTPTLNTPVKITFSTSTTINNNNNNKPNPIIDQSIELTASPSRTVSSLKQSISKQFKSKPPVDCIVFRLDGLVLDDGDVTVSELVEDHLDDNDEEEEEEEEEDDDMPKLTIQVDIIPPVDPKFGTELKEKLDSMTNEQVLDAYVTNMAAMQQNTIDLMQSFIKNVDDDDDDEGKEDSDDEEKEDDLTSSSLVANRASRMDVQQNALTLKEQIIASLSEDERKLLQKTDTPSNPSSSSIEDEFTSGDMLLKQSLKKRMKRRGGATMNVKRTLQKNLNINWPDTIRNFLLFLFFGYFGGRNATSRTIMYLGAPACFISQARPVKIAMKQLFYAIGQPPGLFLSLLPAPQQSIMSCDYNQSMRGIYGDEVGELNELLPGAAEGGGSSYYVSDGAGSDGDSDDDDSDDEGEEEMYDDEYDDDEDEYDHDEY